jgi:hypothetical protein
MSRQPLHYTFGNHMHWVDMKWPWGYGTLPGSARDKVAFCAATGARGNINFDKRTRDLDAYRHVWATVHKAAHKTES